MAPFRYEMDAPASGTTCVSVGFHPCLSSGEVLETEDAEARVKCFLIELELSEARACLSHFAWNLQKAVPAARAIEDTISKLRVAKMGGWLTWDEYYGEYVHELSERHTSESSFADLPPAEALICRPDAAAMRASGSVDDTRTLAPEPIAEAAAKERPPDQVFAMDESNVGTDASSGAPLKLKSEVLQLLQAWDVSDAADALVKHGWTSLNKMQLMEDADVDAMKLVPATRKMLNTQLRTWKSEAAAGRECAHISAMAMGMSAGTAIPSSAPTTTHIEEVGAEEVSTVDNEEFAADAPRSGACDQHVKQAVVTLKFATRCWLSRRAFENSFADLFARATNASAAAAHESEAQGGTRKLSFDATAALLEALALDGSI